MDKYQVLKKYFGYDTLREGQGELIDEMLKGRDVLGIMPTGAGKSLCYQIPALMFSGITLVISPLISLMTDQVKALNQAGIHAAYINSSLTEGQIAKALENAKRGQYKIIYVAPERLETERFMDFAVSADISMVTVDEAHCISQWGQDFRPSYVKIIQFIERLSKRPVVSAFTATATEHVKEDILCILKLNNPKVLVTGFDRKNLFFKVVQQRSTKQKDTEILTYVREHGEEAECILFYSPQDVMINRFLLESKTGNSEMEPEDILLVQENDEIRLNKMSYYCQTKECLRHYILNYFGEQVNGRCEKCGNCQAEYEEKDVTDICRDIITCVEQLRQRYGMNVIVDTLLGRNKAKIRSLGLESSPSFGIRKGEKEGFLKNIISELEQQGYLMPTKDKYMILKLSQSCNEIQNGERQIFIKVSKEEQQAEINESRKASRRKSDVLTSKGLELFDILREFRLSLAREEAVPPYIICSDKTLTDMCVKLPRNKQEMLNVNGIGESKYEKYGERFIEKLQEFTQGEEMKLYY